ncbi:MAG: hypothetical protein NVSMB18_07430 [Acetobacteraceae bacterium]
MPDIATQNAERPLRDAVQRLARSPQARHAGWVALALHLSRLPPPAPRPHHRRIARAVLDDAAARNEGQLFPLANGDLMLLLRSPDGATALAGALARLFQIDAPNPALLLSRWLVPSESDPLLAYVEAASAEATTSGAKLAEGTEELDALGTTEQLIDSGNLSDLTQRQTAVLFCPTDHQPRPLFSELSLSVSALEARMAAGGRAAADPFLLHRLVHRLDARLLRALAEDLRSAGPLTAPMRSGGPMLHLNLTLSGILSPGFASFAGACREAGLVAGVEVALLDACADPEGFLLARGRLRLAGLRLVLDVVSHQALLMTVPAALQPDLLKLEWSPLIPEAGRPLEAAVASFGPAKVVLQRTDTAEALRWGLAQGIRRFQGRTIDFLLAAKRIDACDHATLCTMRQCLERGSATGPGGRSGCRNVALLDAGLPRLATAP